MLDIRRYYDRGKFSLLTLTLYIDQFVHPEGGGDGVKEVDGENRYFFPLQV